MAWEASQKKEREDREREAKKQAEEKLYWERKLEDEKKIALANFEAGQKAAAEAAAAAAQKAKEEKVSLNLRNNDARCVYSPNLQRGILTSRFQTGGLGKKIERGKRSSNG